MGVAIPIVGVGGVAFICESNEDDHREGGRNLNPTYARIGGWNTNCGLVISGGNFEIDVNFLRVGSPPGSRARPPLRPRPRIRSQARPDAYTYAQNNIYLYTRIIYKAISGAFCILCALYESIRAYKQAQR